MSWIQNFFERFKKEEEAEQHEIHTNKGQMKEMRQQPNNKDLDARISYQYPKGQFRFPVIPDDKKQVRRDKERVQNKKQLKERMPSHREYEEKIQKEPVRVKKEPVKVKKEPLTKIHSSGPFRPTEIPSPIFGFNRPKETVVEYELSHFATNIKENQENTVIKDSQAIEESTILTDRLGVYQEKTTLLDGIAHSHHNQSEAISKMEDRETIQRNPVLNQLLARAKSNEEVGSFDRPVDSLHQTEENEIEKSQEEANLASDEVAAAIVVNEGPLEDEAPIIDAENDNSSLDQANYASDEVTAAIVVNEGLLEDEEPIIDAENDNSALDQANYASDEVAAAIVVKEGPLEDADTIIDVENDDSAIDQANYASDEVTEVILVNEGPLEDEAPIIDVENDDSAIDQAMITETESAASQNENSPDQLDPEKPKRKHLPFNVMMLKQDKQKWEERKRERVMEQSATLQHFNSEPIRQSVSEVEKTTTEDYANPEDACYVFPTFQLLNPAIAADMDTEWLKEQENLLNQTLQNFNVGAKVVNLTQGPSVTRFEVQPEPGVKVNKITNLSDDIKLSLAARDIRIEAPIPGKHTIGIEVPNQKSRPVQISEIIQSSVFHESESPLTAVLGLDISGKPIVTDLKKMPHGLIAGATGSGKSVCINTILVSLLYKANPEDLKLLLIDPKMVELAPYNRIPHLVSPVITDVKAATASLKWAVDEMERRYELFAHTGVRDINRFNELAMQHKRYSDKLPFIVIVIDELADLMMMSPADVEEAICRIAQKARACGIHLIIATQRPSVDVITGLIKANIPTRIAFSVSSQVDSRTIIDISGAEKLLGRGDMLFLENGSSKPVRLQGTFVSDEEIDLVVAHVREQQEPNYLFEQEELLKKAQMSEEEDELFYEACEFIVDQSSASTSSLQRRFKIGYNRAARLMEMMEQQGYISSAKGSKPRDVFITAADLETIQETNI